jgi:hypothetical protein
MINLLPQQWQKNLENEKNFKTVTILGIVIFSSLAAFVLMLALVRIFYSVEFDAGQIALAEKDQEVKIFNVEPTEKIINLNDGLISKIGDFYKNKIKITDVFAQISQTLPAGVSLTDFEYSPTKIDLSGIASERDLLVDFRDGLEKNQNFKNIIFPPEDWLTAKDINFNISLEYAKPQQ